MTVERRRSGLEGSPFAVLSDDELRAILTGVGNDHAFLIALVCRRFRDLVADRRAPRHVGRRLVKFQTPRRVAVSSVSIARWARSEEGLDPCLICTLAAGAGNIDVLRWARSADVRAGWDPWAPASAALAGHAPTLEWLHAHGCPFDGRTTNAAAASGHVHVLEWARARGVPVRRSAIVCAARGGHLSAIQWLVSECGLRPCKDACSAAARGGHLETLRFLREVGGARWDPDTTTAAARGGHISVLEWAVGAGCRLKAEEACQHAALLGQAHAVRWLRSHMSIAARRHQRRVLDAADSLRAHPADAADTGTRELTSEGSGEQPPPAAADAAVALAVLARELSPTFRFLGGAEPRLWRPYAADFARSRADYYAVA
eukprot:CAMPEP_0119430210 /NCGR_PEP_ID=MMETSP1335-20130426/43662_1 /TAXON_ID=259385 /ORGANISM="Chrysoculter rhomboideus, Strain RCC1486" /LENGTH=373 /DNA_ID=CAMNT_0007455963 /DNA_START=25 /DNA_END=1143 /DNA_ORIENTATION=+